MSQSKKSETDDDYFLRGSGSKGMNNGSEPATSPAFRKKK
jgi:hypothetical protein